MVRRGLALIGIKAHSIGNRSRIRYQVVSTVISCFFHLFHVQPSTCHLYQSQAPEFSHYTGASRRTPSGTAMHSPSVSSAPSCMRHIFNTRGLCTCPGIFSVFPSAIRFCVRKHSQLFYSCDESEMVISAHFLHSTNFKDDCFGFMMFIQLKKLFERVKCVGIHPNESY